MKTKFLFESGLGQNINTLRELTRHEFKLKTQVDAQLESVKVTTFFLDIYSSQKVRHWYPKNPSLINVKILNRLQNKTWTIYVRFSAHKNVSMWVWHVSQLVWSICTTRIMSWWVNPCVSIKVVISTSSSEERSATRKTHRFWYRSSALIRNLLHQFTRKWPLLLCHYATRTFLACDLVVDVALDQEFLANAAPQRNVHGLILPLA